MTSESFVAKAMGCESIYRSSDIVHIYSFVCCGYLKNIYNANTST